MDGESALRIKIGHAGLGTDRTDQTANEALSDEASANAKQLVFPMQGLRVDNCRLSRAYSQPRFQSLSLE